MTKLDTNLFIAICCEAAFGLIVTFCLLKALFSVMLHGWGDEEEAKLSGLKSPRDARVEDNYSGPDDENNRQEVNGKETQPAGGKKIGVIIVLMFIVGLVLGGWLFYCLFPNTAISKDTLRETTEKFEAAQLDEDGYGMGKPWPQR